MGFREKIELLVDVQTGSSKSAIKGIRDELDQTDGTFAKMKVAGAGALDFIKQNAAGFALGAGAAITGFAVKAISDFQSVALGAGEMRDALGITSEEASRLIEVADDLGIPIDTVEQAIGRMNKTAALSPEKFDAIGAAIARNEDGTINVVETFKNAAEAIDAIPDAGDRALAAQQIFGKGWQGIAELIAGGADDITAAMEGVEDSKVMSDAEVERARDFRDTMDELRGFLESATLTIAGRLVPAVDTVVGAFITAKEAVENFQDALPQDAQDAGFDLFSSGSDIVNDFKRNLDVLTTAVGLTGEEITATVGPAIDGLDASVAGATTSVGGMNQILDHAVTSMADLSDEATADLIPVVGDLAGALEDAEQAARDMKDAYEELKDGLSDRSAYLDVEDALDNYREKAEEAFYAGAAGAEDATQKVRGAEQAQISLKEEVIAYAEEVGNIPPDVITDILAKIDRGELDSAMTDIAALDGKSVDVKVTATLSQIPTAGMIANLIGTVTVPVRGKPQGLSTVLYAKGGRVGSAGGIGGEAGPELVELGGRQAIIDQPTQLPPGAMVTPIDGVGGGGGGYGTGAPMGGGGGNVYVQVTLNAGAFPSGPDIQRLVYDAWASALRNAGPGGARRLLQI